MTDLTDLIVKESTSLSGTVRAPSSKAFTHRVFIAAALSEGLSRIEKPLICDDALATINACRMLGAKIEQTDEETFKVQGRPKPLTPADAIDCRDSGATMRFLTPVCALADGISVLSGGGSLRRRPMEPLLEALRQLGIQCYSARRDGRPPLTVFGGGIDGGEASIRGDVSSQFISGLLFALPMAKSDTDIVLSTPLESKPYVATTLEVLMKHKIQVGVKPDYSRFHVPCGQKYVPFDHIVEGDFSSAAFLLATAVVTDSHLKVKNLNKDSVQGDRVIVDLLEKMSAQVEAGGDFVEVQGAKNSLKPLEADLRDNPDLVPVCAVLSCLADGKSVIRGVKRLRFKESDRIAALSSELTKMGAKIESLEDALIVEGGNNLRGADLNGHEDHRIAMACVVAALKAEGTTVVRGIECINKSYPNFVRDIIALGAKVVER
ncbi:MAG: 3-phosphoshikimate 1-carboxyvinyltransferase [Candidatus Bathyarchaeota archaeon]|nr:3-phosphoshikimate 1-carboxyvinyltransferase [Candidatus Bathyarchaeota archaeon]